jgi:hypothetical protein
VSGARRRSDPRSIPPRASVCDVLMSTSARHSPACKRHTNVTDGLVMEPGSRAGSGLSTSLQSLVGAACKQPCPNVQTRNAFSTHSAPTSGGSKPRHNFVGHRRFCYCWRSTGHVRRPLWAIGDHRRALPRSYWRAVMPATWAPMSCPHDGTFTRGLPSRLRPCAADVVSEGMDHATNVGVHMGFCRQELKRGSEGPRGRRTSATPHDRGTVAGLGKAGTSKTSPL